jgi:hypothetical protein
MQLFASDRGYKELLAFPFPMVQAVRSKSGLITNADHDELTAGLRAAEANLDTAEATHRATPPLGYPLGQVNPGQQVLDIQIKLITPAIRIAAFNTATTLARAIRVHTRYARANREAHALIRQALTDSGDIDPHDGFLTVRLDPYQPAAPPPASPSSVITSPPPPSCTRRGSYTSSMQYSRRGA